ncbi:putative mfs sugar [Phaeomoniella chlamydospora]|uniref:Putative mfs sugar n=1 Tax=Phaeomoniella chlamydospora TaxID=158046 RepID=A0A0G2F498_PHACM|nr:putative mfs sugar [Phaeomoniella chlamydospora]
MSSEDKIGNAGAQSKAQVHLNEDATVAHTEKSAPLGPSRQHSTVSRRLSEAEAIRIVLEGGAAVDEEIADLEAELAANPIQSTFLNPQLLSFNDPRHFTWLLVAFASMGGMLSGVDQSVISGALLYMPGSLHLDTHQKSLTSSAVPLGAIGGALILGPLNESVGRKMAIIISLILYTIGGALEAGAINFGMIVVARVILGMGLGLEGGTVPVYVAESVEKKYRGNLVSLYQFMIAFGEVLGYVVAAIFVNVESGSWRYMLGSSLFFSTIMLIGMVFMPESPRMLMHKGKVLESFAVWKRIRGLETVENRQEFFIMRHAVNSEAHAETPTGKKRFVWLDFFTNPRARRSIIYANIMISLGQLTGINAIMYYMSTLMNQVGFNSKESVFMSLVGGGALMLGTIPGVLYMERFGRRFWANMMLPCFFIGLVFVGISYHFPQSSSAALGTYFTGIILYNGFFGSYACLTWVLPSEVFPTYLRSYGMETTDVNLFFCSFIVTYFFSDMQRAMTKTGLTLGFYGGIAVLGWFYQILFMPETKNKTLEEIDLIFSQPTSQLVAQNLKNTAQTLSDLVHFRFGKVFSPVEESHAVEDEIKELKL